MYNKPKIIIYKSELDFISRCVLDFTDLETGGDFFGFWTKDGRPVIQYVIGPGIYTTRTPVSFYQDINYLKKCGALLNSKYGLEHIGGWHSHHKLGLVHPSSGDTNTMKNALRDQNLPRFLISICILEENSLVSINGFLFNQMSPEAYTLCSWTILEGISPIRESLIGEKTDIFIQPKTIKPPNLIRVGELMEITENGTKNEIEKPELSEDSYWAKPEGRLYLKSVYNKLSLRTDLSNVEILQLTDKRIALAFTHGGNSYEIQFPNDFPKNSPEVVEKTLVASDSFIPVKKIFKSRKKESIIRNFIHSLDILDNGITFIIRHII